MKILLINPYCYPEVSAGKLNKFLTPMPPIGMAYLLAAIEKSRHTPLFHDDLLEKGNDEKLTKLLLDFRPTIIGIPVYSSPVVYRFKEIVKLIRKILPEAYIQSGNLHANYFAREMLREKEVDIVVKGEGEVTICEIADVLERGGSLAEVKGLIYRERTGEIIETANRPYNCDLDRLPFPAWHLMPYKKYNINELGKIAATGTFVLGSRGCPFGCEFCSLLIQGRKRRVRSKENICDEIEWLIKKFKYKSFHFIDPTWPINKKEGIAFAQEMIKRGLHKKIIWGTETRLDVVDEELLRQLYKAGCRKVMYGIESGSQLILDQVNKKNDLQKVRQVIAWSHKYKLSPAGFFIIGLPGETKADIEKTIELALSLKLHFAKFSGFVPYPGTPLYEKLLAEKALPVAKLKDWNSYTSYPSLANPPIYVDKNMELCELINLQKSAHLKFYLRPRQFFYTLAVLRFSLSSIFFAGIYVLTEIFSLLKGISWRSFGKRQSINE
jgi:radical SAM superfamily enzyme YgiQ (UPF0313 family)